MGVAHPPGYPLFVLLGHLAIKLPLPEAWLNSPTPAYRVNLMNATFGAFTGWFMFRCVVLMCGMLTHDKPYANSMLLKAATIAAGVIASVRLHDRNSRLASDVSCVSVVFPDGVRLWPIAVAVCSWSRSVCTEQSCSSAVVVAHTAIC